METPLRSAPPLRQVTRRIALASMRTRLELECGHALTVRGPLRAQVACRACDGDPQPAPVPAPPGHPASPYPSRVSAATAWADYGRHNRRAQRAYAALRERQERESQVADAA